MIKERRIEYITYIIFILIFIVIIIYGYYNSIYDKSVLSQFPDCTPLDRLNNYPKPCIP